MNTTINNKTIAAGAALQMLKDGNRRFINNTSYNRNLLQMLHDNKETQQPFATILSCMDSRAPAELIFDLGIGDIFSIRVAGNVISDNILGSLEYAVAVTGTQLIVVLGHTGCGAVKGACDAVQIGNLTALVAQIRPAIEQEQSISSERHSGNPEFVNKVAAINVHHSIDRILKQSNIIREHHEKNGVIILPAMYDITTGKVDFYD